MAKIVIDRQRCKGCMLCVSACPKGLIIVDKVLNQKGYMPVKFSPFVSSQQNFLRSANIQKQVRKLNNECIGCSLCATMCPDCCITVYK